MSRCRGIPIKVDGVCIFLCSSDVEKMPDDHPKNDHCGFGSFRVTIFLTPNEMKAPITLPAIVAKPPTMTACISDLVMSFK